MWSQPGRNLDDIQVFFRLDGRPDRRIASHGAKVQSCGKRGIVYQNEGNRLKAEGGAGSMKITDVV